MPQGLLSASASSFGVSWLKALTKFLSVAIISVVMFNNKENDNKTLLTEAEEMSRSTFLRAVADRERVLDVVEKKQRTVFISCLAGAAVVVITAIAVAFFASRG